LASAKTIGTLTTEQSSFYLQNVIVGSRALIGSIFSCVILAIVVFCIAYRDRFLRRVSNGSVPKQDDDIAATADLIGRFFIAVFVILFLLVLSGTGLEFKNRWIQPFVCLLPAYFVLRWGAPDRSRSHFDENLSLNRIALMGVLAMIAVTTGFVVRQTTKPSPNHQSVASVEAITSVTGDNLLIAPDLCIASEMKLIAPHQLVLSKDHVHLGGLDQLDRRLDANLEKQTIADLISRQSTQKSLTR
jgi:hypothetical protein